MKKAVIAYIIIIIVMILPVYSQAEYSSETLIQPKEALQQEGKSVSTKDELKTGVYQEFYANGKIHIEAQYQDGILHGAYQVYNQESQLIIEKNYKNGKLHGIQKTFHANGQIKSILTFKDGKQDGESKEYFKNGNLSIICIVENNRLVDQKIFNNEGGIILDKFKPIP